jgi:hypothetical protein
VSHRQGADTAYRTRRAVMQPNAAKVDAVNARNPPEKSWCYHPSAVDLVAWRVMVRHLFSNQAIAARIPASCILPSS